MTAAAGVVHEEFHGREFAQRGGPFEMAQLWVNLPAKDKGARPATRTSSTAEIPGVALPGGRRHGARDRGDLPGSDGPAHTFTPIAGGRSRMNGAKRIEIDVPDGWTTALVVLRGSLRVNGSEPIAEAEVGLFDRSGTSVAIDEAREARGLLSWPASRSTSRSRGWGRS